MEAKDILNLVKKENIPSTLTLLFILVPSIWGILNWHYSGIIEQYKMKLETARESTTKIKEQVTKQENNIVWTSIKSN